MTNYFIMIKKCENNQQEDIIRYIGTDYPKCLYLFLDIIKYGCDSESTKTWIQRQNGQIKAVILAYHTAFHIFSRNDDLYLSEICELVNHYKCKSNNY